MVRESLRTASRRDFRVVEFSVQRDHVHLLVEADDKEKLSRGMQGLSIRVARALNRALGRSGRVWGDRYHARQLLTPRAVRTALVYVIQNFRKHIRNAVGIDPCSSGNWFLGWSGAPGGVAASRRPTPYPRTWLLSVGWRRHGLLSLEEGPKPSQFA